MDQLRFASLSHTHYWYEVGMLKVPAVEERLEEGPRIQVEHRPVAPVAQRYHVTSDTLEREFDPGKRDFSH